MKIDKPPFRAYPVTCGITFTFGGVQIDTHGQVLNTGGQADSRSLRFRRYYGTLLSQLPVLQRANAQSSFRHDCGNKRRRRNARHVTRRPPAK